MCIQLLSFKCIPATVKCGPNNVEFVITYNNPGKAGTVLNGRIASTHPEDPYRFVLSTGSEVRVKEFQHTLKATSGEIRIAAVLKISSGQCDGTSTIQLGVAYRLSTASEDCPGRFTNIRY